MTGLPPCIDWLMGSFHVLRLKVYFVGDELKMGEENYLRYSTHPTAAEESWIGTMEEVVSLRN